MKPPLQLTLAAGAALCALAPAQEEAEKPKPAQKIQAIRALPMMAGGGAAPTQEQLIERRQAKLAEAWIGKANWIQDYDEAREAARQQKKKVFAYFTRSYAP